ncbi:N-acetylmuramic acid 6-phosphate etherase [Sporosarcina cyprini]|uniref:N-acetylmuramic acid 6-phosphate etherase n=1 Tax=Sporosarcina cyprini TaxID=2910523 RepID=UPI001EE06916|nr:N-acetylmuramic acid 6-phosphate etherase [Sporosarcina cyprini]MCG3088122.1 N-acetylmuramic acid 6-phosphate etherase [Sporosarcina cyprini]
MEKISKLITEESNPKTVDLDEMSIREMITVMNEEDMTIALAVQQVLPEIEQAIEQVVAAFKNGGRLIYIGAGTSGRIGVMDAVECPPTFSTPPELVQAVLAGGPGAMYHAVEGAEDDESLGAADLRELNLAENDVVIGIAASGRTPYVKGALAFAQSIGAATVSLTGNANSAISAHADVKIEVITGPEVVAGSTRLRAATAHKMVLNMISTTAMMKIGKIYKNLMVDLHASNFKLKERAKQMVCTITEAPYELAETTLETTNYNVKQAIVMILAGVSESEALELIDRSEGFVKRAVALASAGETR